MKFQNRGMLTGEFCQEKTAVFTAHLIKPRSTFDLKVPIRKGQEFKVLEGIFFLVTQTYTDTQNKPKVIQSHPV